MGFQDSAKHSLNGPPDTVIDVNVAQQNVDTVESAVVKSELSSNEVASSCKRAQAGKYVVNSRNDVASTSMAGGSSGRQDSSRQPVAGFKRPVLPVSVVMETDRSLKTLKLSETRVEGETISCFDVGGEARLCLPQLLSQVLFSIPPSTLQSVTDTLHIYFAECGTAQLEVLKQARVLPETVSRSGLVTLTDAMRICAILLHDHPPRHATPDDMTVIPVQHECFGGCRGLFWPCEYRSASSLCIECMECRGRLSPYQFISHSHTSGENQTCHWGFDCNKWRSYLMLSDEVVALDDQINLQKLLDKMKLLFVGKDDQDLMQEEALVPVKRARVGLTRKDLKGAVQVPFDVGWQSSDGERAWTSCLELLRHTQQSRSSGTLPDYLHTSKPVLDNPERVIPLQDTHRYDRNFVPNVALSVQPFEEVRKQRAAVDSVCLGVNDDVELVSRRRRADQRPPATGRDLDLNDEDDDDDDDTESVSSDKLEADDDDAEVEMSSEPAEVNIETQLSTYLELQRQLFQSVLADTHQHHHKDDGDNDDLLERFITLQQRQMKLIGAIQESRYTAEQKLEEVWSVMETQQREALEARRQHDEMVSKLRQEGAARMREAALSRHQLLQQVEALTTNNGTSNTALMAARYREEADGWKRRLEESEAVNARLRQELVAVHEAVQQIYSTSAARPLTSSSMATAAAVCVQPMTPPDSLEANQAVD